MADDQIEPAHDKAIRLAGNLAKAHARNGGDAAELFATYVLCVVQEDAVIGMTCLDAVSVWFLGAPAGRL